MTVTFSAKYATKMAVKLYLAPVATAPVITVALPLACVLFVDKTLVRKFAFFAELLVS